MTIIFVSKNRTILLRRETLYEWSTARFLIVVAARPFSSLACVILDILQPKPEIDQPTSAFLNEMQGE
jgi:hypothetical protein